jgi:DNA-binding response OmpR family regulator
MSSPTKKILIIEDNESYLSILAQKLTLEEFEVTTAKDGEEGLKKATNDQPDIILIDLLLPKMNGIQIMEELRKNEWGKNVPLIILTNVNPDDEILQTIMKNKPTYYLVKPEVKLEDIVEKVKDVLNASPIKHLPN